MTDHSLNNNLSIKNLIIGAGIAGLTLAKRFESSGQDYLIIEKSRGVGGRMATRRLDLSTFDHGAQFFKIRSDQKSFWGSFFGSPLTHLWFSENHTDFYASRSGMTQIAKSLANKDQLLLNEKFLTVQKSPAGYIAKTESMKTILCENIYLTCPLPQSLQFLKNSQISYDANLNQIQYAKALVGLFEIHTKSQLIQNFNYAENLTDFIYSLSNQFNKGTSQSLAFTITMQSDFSETHFDQTDAINLELVAKSFIHFFKNLDPDNDFFITKSELKKWRYSHPTTTYPKSFYEVDTAKGIYLLGDAFLKSSLVGSIQSAEAVPIS